MERDQPVRVVMVEDNEDHAVLFRKTLESGSVIDQVTVFYDAETALHHLRSPNVELPRFILIDVDLPGMDGIELLGILKEEPGLRRLPVIVLSTSDAESDRSRAYDARANSYLTKPLDFAALRQMAKELGSYWGTWNVPAA